jgi:nitric oxide reductase NorQ protein
MSDLQSINTKLDEVIVRITKSKKFSSVRILEEVKRDLQSLDSGSVQTAEPVVRQTTVVLPKSHNGGEPYVAQNGEVDQLISYLNRGKNVLLTGDTGCGKTHLVEHVSAMMGKTLGTIQGNDGCRVEDIIGYRDLRAGDTTYTYGVLPKTMQTEGGLIYWDEPNATPDGIRFVCFSAMDHRRQITLPQNGGEIIKAKAGFTFVGAMNEGMGYRGTSVLNDAMRDRFDAIIPLAYLPEPREAKLLVARTGVDANIAAKLASAARKLREAMARGDIKTPISTRSLLATCDGIMGGISIGTAIELSIINKVSGVRMPERKTISDVMEAHFGKFTHGGVK